MRPAGPSTRERKVLAAALRFSEADEWVRETRAGLARGNPARRAAVERRKAARRSLLYHAAALRVRGG